jgi:transposase
VSLWRGRFRREGLSGLTDKPRPGSVPKYNAETGKRILAVLDRPPGRLTELRERRLDRAHEIARIAHAQDPVSDGSGERGG